MTEQQKKVNGTAIISISAVLGLLGIIAWSDARMNAIVQPMNQRIDTQYLQIGELKDELRRFSDRERDSNKSLAMMMERFKEVETQFKLFQQVNVTKFTELERRISKGEIDGNPRHDERIKNLERVNGIGTEKKK